MIANMIILGIVLLYCAICEYFFETGIYAFIGCFIGIIIGIATGNYYEK